jgi:hypothetical protein
MEEFINNEEREAFLVKQIEFQLQVCSTEDLVTVYNILYPFKSIDKLRDIDTYVS